MTNSYVAIDLETTGLNPKTDRILEIGAVRVVDGCPMETFSSLVNPCRGILPKITELTGIDGAMVEKAPPVGELMGQVLEFCGDLPLLGHRVIFDYSFLKRAAVNGGLAFEREGLDTLALCRKFMPKEEKKNLAAACAYFGVVNETAHRALSDARAAHFLYQAMILRFGESCPEAFSCKKLVYQVKKEQPATKKQKQHLQDLLKYHKITISAQIDDLSRNEISRVTDKIISRYGRIS